VLVCSKVRYVLRLYLFCLFFFRYEHQEKGLIQVENVGVVPDIYVKNQLMERDIQQARKEAEKFRTAAL